MSEGRQECDVDKRRFHVVTHEGTDEPIIFSLQRMLKENDVSITNFFSYTRADDKGGHGLLVTCCKEVFGFDKIQQKLADKADITRASKNLKMIVLKGSPVLDSIPLYFESPTFCGADDGDVVGYKKMAEDTIVLIVTNKLNQLLEHAHVDRNKISFRVVQYIKKAESIKTDFEDSEPSASIQKLDWMGGGRDTTKDGHEHSEENYYRKELTKQKSFDDKNREKMNCNEVDESDSSDEDPRNGKIHQHREADQRRGIVERKEDNQCRAVGGRIKENSNSEEEHMETDSDEQNLQYGEARKLSENEHKEQSRFSGNRENISFNETNAVGAWTLVSFKAEKNFNKGNSDLAQVHRSAEGKPYTGGQKNTGHGGKMHFNVKKAIEEKIKVDCEERLHLIYYLFKNHKIQLDERKVECKADSGKKLLVISGQQVAVKELMDILKYKLTVLRDPLHRISVDVKLDFGSQLLSQRGREWFVKFIMGANLMLAEEKSGKNIGVAVVSFDQWEAKKYAHALGAHLMCAKIPYDGDIKSGDSKWKSKIKDLKKKGLITIGNDCFGHNVEVYGVPADVIAALDEVDAFVYEREKPGFF